MPYTEPLYMVRNDDETYELYLVDDEGQPANLDGYTIACSIQSEDGNVQQYASSVEVYAATGKVVVTFGRDKTAAMPLGRAFLDILLIDADGNYHNIPHGRPWTVMVVDPVTTSPPPGG